MGANQYDPAHGFVDPVVPVLEKAYAPGPFHEVAIVTPPHTAPLVILIGDDGLTADSGLGLGFLMRSLAAKGFAVAAIGHSDPHYHGEDKSVHEVLEAIAFLRAGAAKWRFDPNRIALVGDGSGAAITARLACDKALLGRTDIPADSIRAVVLVDGVGMDIPAEYAAGSDYLRGHIVKAFGDDQGAWVNRSAIGSIETCRPAAFDLVTVTTRPARARLNEIFAQKLRGAHASVNVEQTQPPLVRHGNTYFGVSTNRATREVLNFLTQKLAEPLPGT